MTPESVGVAQVDREAKKPCRYCGGAKRFQIVSPVSDHAWADCFCTRLTASTEAERAMREAVGWQYLLPEHTLARWNALRADRGQEPAEAWWVPSLCSTREEAERAGGGGYVGGEEAPGETFQSVTRPFNTVRPVFALPSTPSGEPSDTPAAAGVGS